MSPVPEILSQPTALTVLRDVVLVGSVADELECSCYESAPCDACQLKTALHTAYRFLATPQTDSERLRDAAPALRDALKAAQAVDDHEIDCMFCFHADPCGIRAEMAADASAMRIAALQTAATPDAAEGGR